MPCGVLVVLIWVGGIVLASIVSGVAGIFGIGLSLTLPAVFAVLAFLRLFVLVSSVWRRLADLTNWYSLIVGNEFLFSACFRWSSCFLGENQKSFNARKSEMQKKQMEKKKKKKKIGNNAASLKKTLNKNAASLKKTVKKSMQEIQTHQHIFFTEAMAATVKRRLFGIHGESIDNDPKTRVDNLKRHTINYLVIEFLFESLPQMSIQIINNQRRGRRWSVIGVASISVSAFAVVSTLWKYGFRRKCAARKTFVNGKCPNCNKTESDCKCKAGRTKGSNVGTNALLSSNGRSPPPNDRLSLASSQRTEAIPMVSMSSAAAVGRAVQPHTIPLPKSKSNTKPVVFQPQVLNIVDHVPGAMSSVVLQRSAATGTRPSNLSSANIASVRPGNTVASASASAGGGTTAGVGKNDTLTGNIQLSMFGSQTGESNSDGTAPPAWADPTVPFMTRQEAEAQLAANGNSDKDYVVRQSTNNAQGYAICAVYQSKYTNLQVKRQGSTLFYGNKPLGQNLTEALRTLQNSVPVVPSEGAQYFLNPTAASRQASRNPSNTRPRNLNLLENVIIVRPLHSARTPLSFAEPTSLDGSLHFNFESAPPRQTSQTSMI